MNVLGLDLQPSRLTACLREGGAPAWPPPAFAAGDAHALVELIRDPDRALTADVDWASLSDGLESFVGEPIETMRLTATIVAGQAGRTPAPAPFGAVRCISAGDAVLISALGEGYRRLSFGDVVLVVVVGAATVETYGYRLARLGASAVRVERAAESAVIAATGGAYWAADVAAVLGAAAPELDLEAAAAAIWAGAGELASRLSDAPDDEALLAWSGPLAQSMPSAPYFSRRRCDGWRSVARLADLLPAALAQVGGQIGAGARPAIVIAGSGAAWPFAAAIASRFGDVETLASPELALARGAAWWPRIGEQLFEPESTAAERTFVGASAPAAVARLAPVIEPAVADLAAPQHLLRPPAVAPTSPPGDGDLADLALLERLSQAAQPSPDDQP
jgi:hypothetical protein